MTAIDETDQRILTMLEADGRATLAQLAQATGLSVSAAQSRVQKLEKRGIIKAVPYTHLDVYKRQALGCAVWAGGCRGGDYRPTTLGIGMGEPVPARDSV